MVTYGERAIALGAMKSATRIEWNEKALPKADPKGASGGEQQCRRSLRCRTLGRNREFVRPWMAAASRPPPSFRWNGAAYFLATAGFLALALPEPLALAFLRSR